MVAQSKVRGSARSISNDLSLEELVAQQGVKPIADLDALGALWPAEDDPDRFAAFVNTEREQRRLANSKD